MTWLTWSLLSAFFAAVTAIFAKLGVEGIDANLATAIRTTVVVLFTWLIAYAARQPARFQTLSTKTWLFLVLSGFTTGLSWLCYFRALQDIWSAVSRRETHLGQGSRWRFDGGRRNRNRPGVDRLNICSETHADDLGPTAFLD